MYIEASGKKLNAKARMQGPKIQAKPNGTCDMKLYYHMFGRHVKELNTYVLKDDNTMILLARLTGDSGDMWRQQIIDLSKQEGVFRIILEGKFLVFFRDQSLKKDR